MTVISFWNTRRLGRHTDLARAAALTTISAQRHPQADLNLYCELTTLCLIPQAQNLTYRRPNRWQLCYGARDNNGLDVPLTRYLPGAGAGYVNTGFAGGNYFVALANRAVAYAGNYGGVDVFLFHAPAQAFAATRAMAFVASSLDAQMTYPHWLLIGDFNVTPFALGPTNIGFQVAQLIRNQNVDTYYNPQTGIGSELDYALTNRADVGFGRPMRRLRWMHFSDHAPIFIRY